MADKGKKLKIAFTHVALDCKGGAERKLLLIAQHINRLPDVELEIFVNHFDPEKTFKEYLAGLRIREVKALTPISKFLSFFKIASLTKNADLIHAHNHPSHIAAVFSKIIKKKPVLWFDNEPILYLEGTKKREHRVKLAILRVFEKIFLPFIDIIVANSQNTQNNIKRFLGRDSVIIYSGVDTSLLKPLEKKPESGRFTFFTISRFDKEKNIGFVLRLAEKFPEYEFIIAGNGSQESGLRAEIKEKGLSNTQLLAAVSEQKKVELYQTSGAFVFPTLNEPLGINVVEAMSCGLPVAAFNSGGAKETVVDGKTGFLAETEEDFISKIKLLAENPDLRKQMGLAGRQRVIEHFSLEQMINKTIALYKKLLVQYGKKELADILK